MEDQPEHSSFMNILFRTDASLKLGLGHVIRCLSIAKFLRASGANCYFTCIQLPGNCIDLIASSGFKVLEAANPANWSEEEDAQLTIKLLKSTKFEWVIVDHYWLGVSWEHSIKEHVDQLMVVDDLKGRVHDCDLFLDQNLDRSRHDYQFINPDTRVLLGPKYALLDRQYLEARAVKTKTPRKSGRNIIISLGGSDPNNLTGNLLEQMSFLNLPEESKIFVVLGKNYQHSNEIKKLSGEFSVDIKCFFNTAHMSQLLLMSDIAVGCAGSSSWERCCLGVPTIMLIDSQNQAAIARSLQSRGVGEISELESISSTLENLLAPCSSRKLQMMGKRALEITDGKGAIRVVDVLKRRGAL